MNPQQLAFGAIERPQAISDIELGSVTPQSPIPAVYVPTYTNFIDMQAKIGCCGAGAGKALKEVFTNIEGNPTHLSMEYLWKKIKDVDGIPLGNGTTLLGIMKALNKYGVCTNDLLPTDAINTDSTVFGTDNTTQEQNTDASIRKVGGYAFQWSPTFQDIKTAIYNHKAVILLMTVGQEFWINKAGAPSWGVDLFPLNPNYPKTGGHFVLAYAYDENYVYFCNQWSSSWGQNGMGWFGEDYASRVVEMGTAVDFTQAPLSELLFIGSKGSAVSLLQKKLGIPVDGVFGNQTRQAVINFQKAHSLVMDGIVGFNTYSLLNQATGGTIPNMDTTQTNKPWYLSKTIWFSILTLAVSIIGAITNTFPTTAGVLGGIASIINLLLRFSTSLPIQ